MAGPLDAPLDGRAIAAERAELTARATLAGRPLAEQLAAQADAWFARLGRDLTRSWALVATGGYARGVLCPGSDIDVVLLHPRKAKPAEVRAVAESLWYPIWDAGLKLSPSAHTTKSLLGLASDDLPTATSLLTVRHLAGDEAPVQALARAQSNSGTTDRCAGWPDSAMPPRSDGTASARSARCSNPT